MQGLHKALGASLLLASSLVGVPVMAGPLDGILGSGGDNVVNVDLGGKPSGGLVNVGVGNGDDPGTAVTVELGTPSPTNATVAIGNTGSPNNVVDAGVTVGAPGTPSVGVGVGIGGPGNDGGGSPSDPGPGDPGSPNNSGNSDPDTATPGGPNFPLDPDGRPTLPDVVVLGDTGGETPTPAVDGPSSSDQLIALRRILEERDWMRFAQGNSICLPSFRIAQVNGWLPQGDIGAANQLLASYGNDIGTLRNMLKHCNAQALLSQLNVESVVGIDLESDGTVTIYVL